jgi:hypothetical protein
LKGWRPFRLDDGNLFSICHIHILKEHSRTSGRYAGAIKTWCPPWDSPQGIPAEAINPENPVSKTGAFTSFAKRAWWMVMDSNHRCPYEILIYSQAPSITRPTIQNNITKTQLQNQKSPETFRCNPGFPRCWVVFERLYIESRSRIACLALSSNRE